MHFRARPSKSSEQQHQQQRRHTTLQRMKRHEMTANLVVARCRCSASDRGSAAPQSCRRASSARRAGWRRSAVPQGWAGTCAGAKRHETKAERSELRARYRRTQEARRAWSGTTSIGLVDGFSQQGCQQDFTNVAFRSSAVSHLALDSRKGRHITNLTLISPAICFRIMSCHIVVTYDNGFTKMSCHTATVTGKLVSVGTNTWQLSIKVTALLARYSKHTAYFGPDRKINEKL